MNNAITTTKDHADMAHALFATPATHRRFEAMRRAALSNAIEELARDGPGLNGWRLARVERLEARLGIRRAVVMEEANVW